MTERADIPALREYFTGLQERVVAGLGAMETSFTVFLRRASMALFCAMRKSHVENWYFGS